MPSEKHLLDDDIARRFATLSERLDELRGYL